MRMEAEEMTDEIAAVWLYAWFSWTETPALL